MAKVSEMTATMFSEATDEVEMIREGGTKKQGKKKPKVVTDGVETIGKGRKKWYRGNYYPEVLMPDGKVKRVHKTVPLGLCEDMTRKQAVDKLRGITAQVFGFGRTPRHDGSMTLGRFLEDVYFPLKRSAWGDVCRENKKRETRRYLRNLKDYPINKIDRLMCQKLLDDMVDHPARRVTCPKGGTQSDKATATAEEIKPYAHSLIKVICDRLKEIFRIAHEEKYLEENPARHVTCPKGGKQSDKTTATAEDIMTLVDAIEDPRDQCLFAIAAFDLTRSAEVFGLLWKSYRGDHFVISSVASEGILYRDQAKTCASRKPFPIADFVQPFITKWRELSLDTSPDALMFPHLITRGKRKGEIHPLRTTTFFQRRIYPIAKKLGIPTHSMCSQVLRRTGSTDLQSYGTINDEMVICRHSPETALGTYQQPIPESAKAALERRTQAVLNARKSPSTDKESN